MNTILNGDSLDVLKTLEDESVDLLCTDPPYGYSFMGKAWDKTLPDIGIFKESFRVLKPGAFAFVMSAPRSDVCARMMLMLEDAGFEIGFTPIYWTYASGFPKAMNIGKMVDKREGHWRGKAGKPTSDNGSMTGANYERTPLGEPITAAAAALDGSYGGFQPKPAVEVVIVAMKPLSEKTYVDQALKNGKGITWLDDCRVPHAGTDDQAAATPQGKVIRKNFAPGMGLKGEETNRPDTSGGRFPANLLVSDDVLNDGVERKSGKAVVGTGGHGSSDFMPNSKVYSCFADSGSYSRFFSLDAWAQTLPFLAVPKASKREKNEGLDSIEPRVSIEPITNLPSGKKVEGDKMARFDEPKKNHPTVKPLKLMSYLITLGSRPGDVVLDPFLGSGTTAIAAKQLGRNYVGIEREAEYVEIATARLNAATS